MKELFYLWALGLAVACVAGQDKRDATQINPHECGVTARVAKRYADGQIAPELYFAWHVAIWDLGKASSGSLINSQWVLTSAYRYT